MNQSEAAGWLGRLELGFEAIAGETRLVRRTHEGPLRVQKAFFPEGRAVPHVVLLHPPGGVVGGDRLEIDVEVGAQASALITTPAAQKLYRSSGPEALQRNRLRVGRGGALEWLPGETIAFDGACVATTTRVELEEESAFIGWDLTCYGRPSSGSAFETGRLRQRFEIHRGKLPLLIERAEVGGGSAALGAPWGLRGPVMATLYAVPRVATELAGLVDRLRERLRASAREASAVSALGDLLVVRASGTRLEHARAALIECWQALRPAILARDATLPRIWAT